MSKTDAAVTLPREDHRINLGGNAEASLSSHYGMKGFFNPLGSIILIFSVAIPVEFYGQLGWQRESEAFRPMGDERLFILYLINMQYLRR